MRILSVAASILVVAILRPWTVRPLHLDKPRSFDAATYAQSVWPRVVSDAAQHATEVASSVPSPGAARFVKGSGVVTAVDRGSRVGLLRVQVSGLAAPVVIQVGPVIRGTALRDASAFIQFSDFTNQTEYAAAANALNDYALRTVIAPLPLETLQGRTVTFTGAIGKTPLREDGAIEIVPVQLAVFQAVGIIESTKK